MSGPLDGIVVADFSQLVQGPFATQILGDLGAEIIKIEPVKGDWMRHFALGNCYLGGESVSFLGFNRNKRSIAIDLKHPRGVEVVLRILARADVVVENFRPGVMDRLGLGYENLAAHYPRLIYCASSGFGQTGPYRNRPGQDLLIQAMTGLPLQNGRRDDPPTAVGFGVADVAASQHIVYAVTAALYHRERTGCGQRVDVNLYNSLLALMTQELTAFLNGAEQRERSASVVPSPYVGAPYGIYPTADGNIAIAMTPINELARLVGVEGYEEFDSQNLFENRDQVCGDLARAFARRTTAEWLTLLLAEDIWCASVYTFADVKGDPQVAANEMIVQYDHPTAGTVHTVGIPVKFHGTPGTIRRAAPRLGEHRAIILREMAGYAEGEIEALERERVFG